MTCGVRCSAVHSELALSMLTSLINEASAHCMARLGRRWLALPFPSVPFTLACSIPLISLLLCLLSLLAPSVSSGGQRFSGDNFRMGSNVDSLHLDPLLRVDTSQTSTTDEVRALSHADKARSMQTKPRLQLLASPTRKSLAAGADAGRARL